MENSMHHIVGLMAGTEQLARAARHLLDKAIDEAAEARSESRSLTARNQLLSGQLDKSTLREMGDVRFINEILTQLVDASGLEDDRDFREKIGEIIETIRNRDTSELPF